MKQVSFTEMKNGSREDYKFLQRLEKQFVEDLADRVLLSLKEIEGGLGGYQISRLDHALQSATRAKRAEEDDEFVVACLLHDIGDPLAPYNHGEMAAAILRPYVSDEVYWIVKHHGIFQAYYYAHHLGGNRDVRDRYKEHPYYAATVRFCENYDQNCFDPAYDTLPLSAFEPTVRSFFAREPFAFDRS